MRETISWIAGIILAIATARYCYLIYKGRIRSSLAGWTIAAIANGIGCFAYFQTDNPTWLGNITQLLGTIEILIVWLVLCWLLYQQNALGLEFDRFQKFCLYFAGGIVAVWFMTNADIAFFSVQALLVVSYIAVLGKVLSWKKNLDYIPMWCTILVVASLGLVPAIIDDDLHGKVNSIRAIVSAGIIVLLMLRIKQD